MAHPPTGDEQKAFNGSCVVARATTKEEVMEEIRKDIYATSGVWNLDQVMIYPVSSRMEYDVLFVTRRLTCVVHDGVSQGASGRGVVSDKDG